MSLKCLFVTVNHFLFSFLQMKSPIIPESQVWLCLNCLFLMPALLKCLGLSAPKMVQNNVFVMLLGKCWTALHFPLHFLNSEVLQALVLAPAKCF